MDSVQLLKEIGVISDVSPEKAAEYEDGAGTDISSREETVSVRLIKRAARKIHDAGGCDAKDEYSRGYDDAVTMALDILLEETGYVLEDVLDYEEDKET